MDLLCGRVLSILGFDVQPSISSDMIVHWHFKYFVDYPKTQMQSVDIFIDPQEVSFIENDRYVFSIASYNIYECNFHSKNPHNIAETWLLNCGLKY